MARRRPVLTILAGANGAGKSSLGGAAVRRAGGDYYNPDEAAAACVAAHPRWSREEANAAAWEFGRQLLEQAIREGKDFALETTLGGETIARLLEEAADSGFDIRVWYAGLASAELHLQRVRARARRGGHDIPASLVRRRFHAAPRNLVRLMPRLAALRVFDNSAAADPAGGAPPRPVLVLHLERGRILGPRDLAHTPEWAKPIVARAMEIHAGRGR